MVIYPYIVNLNGTWYPAGTDVPESHENSKEELNVVENEVPKRTRSKKNKAAEE